MRSQQTHEFYYSYDANRILERREIQRRHVETARKASVRKPRVEPQSWKQRAFSGGCQGGNVLDSASNMCMYLKHRKESIATRMRVCQSEKRTVNRLEGFTCADSTVWMWAITGATLCHFWGALPRPTNRYRRVLQSSMSSTWIKRMRFFSNYMFG